MSTNGDWRDAIPTETEVEQAAVEDADSYAEAQRLVTQYREEGIPDSDSDGSGGGIRRPEYGTEEGGVPGGSETIQDPIPDTDPSEPVDQEPTDQQQADEPDEQEPTGQDATQQGSDDTQQTDGQSQDYPEFIETDAQKAMWDDTNRALRRKYREAGGPEERAEVKVEWRKSRRQGEEIDYQGPIATRIEPEGGDLPGGFSEDQLEDLTTPEAPEDARPSERFPELYRYQAGTVGKGVPLPGRNITVSEAAVPVDTYKFDPDDPVDVARYLSKREQRQQSQERIQERREAEERIRTGEVETPQVFSDQDVLQQPVDIEATEEQAARDELRQEFASRYTEATVGDLSFEAGDITLKETDEGGYQPRLTEDARSEIEQFQQQGFRQNLRETTATTISGRFAGIDVGPEDIGIRQTEEGLQPTLERSGERELLEFQREGQAALAAKQFDRQTPTTDISAGDIQLGGPQGPTLADDVQSLIQERRREQAREEATQQFDEQTPIEITESDLTREDGEFALDEETEAELTEQRREQAAEEFGVAESDVVRTDDGFTVSEDVQAERARQQLNQQFGFGLSEGEVDIEDGEVELLGPANVEVARERAQLNPQRVSLAQDLSGETGVDVDALDFDREGDQLTLDEDVAEQVQQARAESLREEVGVDEVDTQTMGTGGMQRTQTTFNVDTLPQDESDDTGGVGDALSAFVPQGEQFTRDVVRTSAQSTETLTTDVVEPFATRSAQGVELLTDPVDTLIEVDETGDIEVSGPEEKYESALTGVGKGLTYGTVGLPAAGYSAGRLTGEAAQFTAENPKQAPGAAYDVSKSFVESEIDRAQEDPYEYGGEVAGGALIGYGVGKAAGPTLQGTRTGAALRKIDVGTRAQRRLRTEFRGALDRDTASLGREAVVGNRLREQAQRVTDIDFDEFIGSQRGQLQIGKQTSPDSDTDTGDSGTFDDLIGRDIAGTDPDVGERSFSPGMEKESATTLTRSRGGAAERRRAGASDRATQRDPESIGKQEPDFEERYFDPQTGKMTTPDIDADTSLAPGALGAQAGAVGVGGLLTQAQQPQVTAETETLQGTEEDTSVTAELTERLEGVQKSLQRSRGDIRSAVDTETGVFTTPAFETGVTTTGRTDIGTRLDTDIRATPDTTPDTTPDPTPDLTPTETPPPRPPRPPELDIEPDNARREKSQAPPTGIDADEFDNQVLSPGEAADFDPFTEE